MSVRSFVKKFIQIHPSVWAAALPHTHAHIHTHTYTHPRFHRNIFSQIDTHIHTHTHTRAHTHSRTSAQTPLDFSYLSIRKHELIKMTECTVPTADLVSARTGRHRSHAHPLCSFLPKANTIVFYTACNLKHLKIIIKVVFQSVFVSNLRPKKAAKNESSFPSSVLK